MQIVQEFMQRLNFNKCKIEEKEKKFKLYLIPKQYIFHHGTHYLVFYMLVLPLVI